MSQETNQLLEVNHRVVAARQEPATAIAGVEPKAIGAPAKPMSEAAGNKECPMCAELIRARALKCRYCGHMMEICN